MELANRTELLGMDLKSLESYMQSLGEPRYRANQIFAWIYRKAVGSFYEMSDIPKELRLRLDAAAQVSIPRVLKQRVSADGTRKFLFEMNDKKRIEAVVIPQSRDKHTRYSLCISTQVGCPLGCLFCATGQSGFQRNLQTYEMVGQVLGSRREMTRKLKTDDQDLITNVVYMGMGEPMLNYDAVISSIRALNDHKGINIGQRHITISTAGEVQGIRRLAEEGLQVTLAISLHACNDELRDRLIPLNRKYPLQAVVEAVDHYTTRTNRRVTFEYIMLDDVNTSPEDARAMIALIKPLLANVNLIPYNEVSGLEYKKPSSARIRRFYNLLADAGLNVTLREEHGGDIEAACGQLSTARER
ncbi:MAG: 23S rRNA (adenine(2503)-C(2))-methyltransferase RlmN [Syntrophomonadaceae bacterium]|nr:23S rRNA (adenine(2503)-C(2))-methyltransferase RlmN [Syntrophomonadaceae bacterium]